MAVDLFMSAKRSRATMADDRRGPPPDKRQRSARAQQPGEERPFDVWLNRQLHAMYDDIAQEPLPRDVVELIERDSRDAAAATSVDGSGQQAPPAGHSQRDED
jgi:hypothetical protein